MGADTSAPSRRTLGRQVNERAVLYVQGLQLSSEFTSQVRRSPARTLAANRNSCSSKYPMRSALALLLASRLPPMANSCRRSSFSIYQLPDRLPASYIEALRAVCRRWSGAPQPVPSCLRKLPIPERGRRKGSLLRVNGKKSATETQARSISYFEVDASYVYPDLCRAPTLSDRSLPDWN